MSAFYTIAYLRARCVANQEGCWIWQGCKTHGYGFVGPNQTGARNAHKVMYILTYGMVPDGLTLDHTCRNRDCLNPDHLEPVTHLENCRRGIQRCSKLTECAHGHPFVEGSYYLHGGKRICKECNAVKCRKYQKLRKERSQPKLADLFALEEGNC